MPTNATIQNILVALKEQDIDLLFKIHDISKIRESEETLDHCISQHIELVLDNLETSDIDSMLSELADAAIEIYHYQLYSSVQYLAEDINEELASLGRDHGGLVSLIQMAQYHVYYTLYNAIHEIYISL